MNYLFTFGEVINLWVLVEFEQFMEDLGVQSYCESANNGLREEMEQSGEFDPSLRFPDNFIMVYADTEDQDLLDTISNKYTRLIAECPAILKEDPAYGQDALQ